MPQGHTGRAEWTDDPERPWSPGAGRITRLPRAAGELRHNLPAEVTSFVGRERELAEVERLLGGTRLLTLTGAPGVGKTRLAQRVAAQAVGEGGSRAASTRVWLVELAALADPTVVPQTVATALGLREQPGRSLHATLTDVLRPRRTLLVLDNCEHLLEACAALADGLLRACPELRILATSRQVLGIAGETTWLVPSLALPADGPPPVIADLPAALLDYESVRLFVERANAALPGFTLTDRSAPAAARICRRLDGIPLAIELAAARVKVLTPEQIAERLDDRFRLLTGGSRMALPRQQTLRAAVDWSYELLSEPERALLRRLAVFAGGWSLEAAEAVASGEWRVASGTSSLATHEVLDLLSGLVEKSLVVAEAPVDGALRYRMLETLQQYALECLVESGEVDEARRRHAACLLALAEPAERQLRGPRETEWSARLEEEHENLRAALRWAIDCGEAEVAQRLGGALWIFWQERGHLFEGLSWLEQALALGGQQGDDSAELRNARAGALNAAGNLAWVRSEYARSATFYEESLALRRQLGDTAGAAISLHNLGLIARDLGDRALAHARFSESLGLFRDLSDSGHTALALLNLARLSHDDGDAAKASTLYEESLALFRAAGNAGGVATVLNRLGDLARARGDLETSGAFHEEALALHRGRVDPWGIGISLTYLARVADVRGDAAEAMALASQSLRALRDSGASRDIAAALVVLASVACAMAQATLGGRLLGAVAQMYPEGPPSRPGRASFEPAVAAARAALGEAGFEAAWTSGKLLTLDQAVDEALAMAEPAPPAASEPAKPSAGPPVGALTRREREVAALIARGLTNRQIADELVISEMTADTHVSHILRKLGFRSRAQVATWITEQGLHPPSS